MSVIPFLCLLTAVGLLIALSWIDLKTRLLPNKLVLPLALTAIAFHIGTNGQYLSALQVIMGGATGYCILYSIRFVANKVYGMDALGLGDVKLMGAGGLWLGVDLILIALVIGSAVSLLHGLVYGLFLSVKTGKKLDLARLQIPAGPGFAAGLLVSGYLLFF